MTAELIVLVLTAFLAFGQIFLVATLRDRQIGPGWNTSPRDGAVPVLTGAAARADRALKNLYESLPLFIIAVLALVLADKTTGLSAGLAWIWLAARLVYVPAYLNGWSPWRSAIWAVGFLALLLMLILALI